MLQIAASNTTLPERRGPLVADDVMCQPSGWLGVAIVLARRLAHKGPILLRDRVIR